MKDFDFGMVGLGVMGRNLLLNMADHNFSVIGLDLDEEKAQSLEEEALDNHIIKGTTSAEEFVASIRKPRAIMLLVPAGKPVDAVINSLVPFLEEGDIVVDGGNSYFPDTNRRVEELDAKGIHFFGMGISGGEKGARFGPSMMPGGNEAAYERLRPVFEAIAAKVNDEPCVTYLGSGSAGNYVKMVHNGIEYAIMELIAETYDLLKRGFGIEDTKIQQLFEEWNSSELASFLIEISAEILKKEDDITGELLINYISDTARAKGTGKWTSQNAMDIQAPVPSIDAAVQMRDISKYKEERVKASKALQYSKKEIALEEQQLFNTLKDAFYFSMINIYAQGMAQLHIASQEYNYGLNLEEVAKIWRGGCIIRAVCLEDFRQAYQNNSSLPNLLLDEKLGTSVSNTQQAARDVVKMAIDKGIPVSVFMSCIAYFDSYRSETLPTNFIQAQRDYFGAHKYERTDREGVFHTEWN